MLTTERLLLRRPTPADLEIVAPFVGDWDHDVAGALRRWLEEWETYPAGKLVVERLADGVPVGRVGLNFFDPTTWARSAAVDAQPELGWTLAPEHWGKGYATEAATAVRDWFAADRLVSLIAPGNLRSQRVAERLGARPAETVHLPESGPHLVWVHP